MPLSRLRQEQLKAAAAARKSQEAEAERLKANATRAALATEAQSVAIASENEQVTQRLEQGELRASDLSRHCAWTHVAALTRDRLQNTEDALVQEHVRAEAALHEATEKLASKKREAEVVDKHQARWIKAEHKRTEDAQTEDIEDRWRRP